MPLPANNTPWPPTRDLNRYEAMKVNSVWYEGDPAKLAGLYAGGTVHSAPADASEGLGSRLRATLRRWFWGQPIAQGEKDTKVHVPIAQDIATLSSELLFAETPVVKLDPPKVVETRTEENTDALGVDHPEEVTKEIDPEGLPEAQATLEWLLDRIDFQATLLAAAETQSPLGSVCLRVAWDKEVDPEAPFFTRVDADAAVPEYRWGKLVALTFWRIIHKKDQMYVRHLERYERGKIYHGVYEGTSQSLGIAVPLANYEDTAVFATLVNDESYIETPEGTMLATSIPNALPDPSDRQSAIGRSDFTPGVLTLMDAVDEIATSLMRDIALGKGRVFLARYMLEDNGAGQGASFNEDQQYFSPLKMNPGDENEAPLVANQFKIRVDEHLKAIEWYASKAVRAAGYNPDSDYGEGGQEMTATEYSGRNRRSFSTRSKKILYWQNNLEGIVEALIRVFNKEFAGGNRPPIPEDWPVKIEWPPAAHPDLRVLAETAQLMLSARAAATRTRVQLLHPDWTDQEIDAEVDLLAEEEKSVDPATFGLSPMGPNPPEIATPSPFGDEQAPGGAAPAIEDE